MIVTCPSCSARLRFNEKALSPQNPTIKCVRCQTSIHVELPAEPAPAMEDHTLVDKPIYQPTEVGWIIVHDEYTQTQTLPLQLGRQTIGRASISKPCEVMIQSQDRYMSRLHLVIEVIKTKEGAYKYWLSEHPDCTNPTFVNTYPLKRGTTLEILDGATLQLGKTKVVLKTIAVVGNARKATDTVVHSEYLKTVLF